MRLTETQQRVLRALQRGSKCVSRWIRVSYNPRNGAETFRSYHYLGMEMMSVGESKALSILLFEDYAEFHKDEYGDFYYTISPIGASITCDRLGNVQADGGKWYKPKVHPRKYPRYLLEPTINTVVMCKTEKEFADVWRLRVHLEIPTPESWTWDDTHMNVRDYAEKIKELYGIPEA